MVRLPNMRWDDTTVRASARKPKIPSVDGEVSALPTCLLVLAAFFFGGSRALTRVLACAFWLEWLLRRFGLFSLLVAALVRLLVRGLFLHSSIISQIGLRIEQLGAGNSGRANSVEAFASRVVASYRFGR